MKRYSAYKDSGVEWMGEIPEHWSIAKIKFTDNVIMGQSPSSEDYNDLMLGLPFLQGNADFTSLYPSPRIWCNTAKKKAIKGDVLLSVRAPIGAVNIANQDYGIGRGLCSIRSIKTNPKLLFYFAVSLNGELNKLGTGSTFTAIAADDVANSIVPSIDLLEQEGVVKYLDRKTHLIDTLIEKKQKQIELLKEQRVAIVNQAVTKGLNPNVNMRNSGIVWLGEVPEHWSVAQLKFYVETIETGPFGSQLHANEYVDNGIPVLNPANIINGQIKPNWSCSVSSDTSNRLQRHKLRAGDILFARRGEMGRVAEILDEQEGWICGTGCIKVRPNQLILNSSFLASYLSISGVKDWLSLESVGSTMENLNSIIISEIPVVLTPINEQNSIINHIKKTSKQIDKSINKIQKLCDKLKEYRTTLISDVVTGKIDVRDKAIP